MSTRNQIEIESQKDPATLEREIDQKRAEISHIVDALENKLSPGEMIDRALGYARGNGGEFLGNLTGTLKANPVPTLLTGIGLVWLMAGQNRRDQPPVVTAGATTEGASARDKLAQKSADIKTRAEHVRESVSGSLGSTRSRVGESMSNTRTRLGEGRRHAGESLRNGATRARGGYERMRNEQPWALGAIGVALGALFAATIPPTRREDELMGHTRDQVSDRLRHKAEEGYEKASAKGEEMAGQLRQERSNGQAAHASGPH